MLASPDSRYICFAIPPYHSKYNAVERVWAASENYWNFTLLTAATKVIQTIQNMIWKGITRLVIFIDKYYQKGIKLNKKQMKQRQQYLGRNPPLSKWDLWIKPVFG